MYLFHDALFKPMAQGLYTPSLAESWTVSPDAKVYEFKLRRGVKFHNGDPLTAEDVVLSFMRYKGSLAKAIHGKMEKAEAVDPYSVRVRFKEPFPEFLEYLLPGATTFGWIAPKKYVEKVGDAGFKKHPIGAGPYKFVEHVPGVKLVGEAFEEYWRKVPHVKRLEFYNIPESATRLDALLQVLRLADVERFAGGAEHAVSPRQAGQSGDEGFGLEHGLRIINRVKFAPFSEGLQSWQKFPQSRSGWAT